MEHKKIQENVNKLFVGNFGRTPLTMRLKDIESECRELCNYIDLKNLKEETGDLLATLIQLCNESEWDIAELLKYNEEKIKRRTLQYKGSGRKTQVAILGGAFNPVSKAHIELAKLVLNASRWADEVWMMPAFQHMDGKQMLSSEHRIEMLKIAASNDGRIKVCDYEIKHQLHGETYHMLNKLIHDKEYENYRFSFVIGIDRANTIKDWYNSEELLKMDVPFIVVPRSGVKRDELINWYLQSPHIYIQNEGDSVISSVSSTMARNYLKDFYNAKKSNTSNYTLKLHSLRDVVCEDVLGYMLKNNLYEQPI